MISTVINESLGLAFPLFQGGMAWIADGKLAAAVSEAGGLGIISAMAGGDYLRGQIKIARELTKKPIGVNLMLQSNTADEAAQIIIDEGIEVVTTGAGMPTKFMPAWLDAGIKSFRSSPPWQWQSAWKSSEPSRLSPKVRNRADTSAS